MRQPAKFAPPPMGGHAPAQQMPPQAVNAPPMAPPKGGAGPRSMAAGLAPPQRGPQSSSGAPAESSVDAQQLQQNLVNLFGLYAQVETN